MRYSVWLKNEEMDVFRELVEKLFNEDVGEARLIYIRLSEILKLLALYLRENMDHVVGFLKKHKEKIVRRM